MKAPGGSSTSQSGGSGGGTAGTTGGASGTSSGGITGTSGGTTGASSGGTTGASSGGITGTSSGGITGASGGASGKAGGSTGASGGVTGTSSGGGTGTSGGGITGTSGGASGKSGGSTGMSGGSTGTSGGTTGKSGGATGANGGSTGTTGSGDGGGSSTVVTVQLDQAEQQIMGFGINNSFTSAMSDADADAMFNTTGTGLGLSILRIGMGSDGNTVNAATDTWADMKKAYTRGATTFIGSVWSPPANCKTNNTVNDGGHLCSSTNSTGSKCTSSAASTCYDSWSSTIAAFPAKVKAGSGYDLYAMSPQNEPDFASCGNTEPCSGNYATNLFTADEMVAFVKVVGPKLQALSPPVKVLAPEASEWNHLWSNESACCSEPSGKNSTDPLKCGFPPTNTACTTGGGYDYGHYLYADPTAWAAVDLVGVHEYDSLTASPWPADVPDKKPVWQTEVSGVKWWPEQGPSSDINNGIAVAGWIHSALAVGQASAWLYWWYKGSYNTGLLLSDGTDTKRHYTVGNYSKFVRPGYTRVDITGSIPTDVLLSAYKGADGTVVVVAINQGTGSATLPIAIAGGTAPASLVPWVTSASDNLASKTAVPVSTGSFTATLASMTVTTFVGK